MSNTERIKIIVLRILMLLLFFLLWRISQSLISMFKSQEVFSGCILDQALKMSTPVNAFLNTHVVVTKILLILLTLEIDCLTLFIFIYSAFSKSARIVIGLGILMILRQFCQMMVLLPFPKGLIWFNPHFPTLFVTYTIRNDFFFSGHTALTVFAALAIGRIFKYKYIGLLKWGLIIFQIFGVLAIRVHYFMDIYAAFMTALVVDNLVWKLRLPQWLDYSDYQKNTLLDRIVDRLKRASRLHT